MKKLKIVLFATHSQAIPVLQLLAGSGNELKVVTTDQVNPQKLQFETAVTYFGLDLIRVAKPEMPAELLDVLKHITPDICLVFTFGFKIPPVLLNIPLMGFYNVHFSMLPQNRGAAPLFWHIKNQLPNGGWSIIRMDERFDTGPVVFQEKLDLMPGEISGSYAARLSYAVLPAIDKLLSLCLNGEEIVSTPQAGNPGYFPKPAVADLRINWNTQTAAEILHLVNACNPDYEGAISAINGVEVRILEVTEVNFQLSEPRIFGEIIFADPSYGVFVYCFGHTFLRLNSLRLPEGHVSGFKLLELGVNTGMKFESQATG